MRPYFLDPGHPAAAEYLAQIYLNVVRDYAVDGFISTTSDTRRPPRCCRAADEEHVVAGVSFYLYAVTGVPAPAAGVDRLAFLVATPDGTQGRFANPASAP